MRTQDPTTPQHTTNSLEESRPADSVPVAIIRPPRGWAPLELKELLNYHELLYFLVWRDLKVRYKQKKKVYDLRQVSKKEIKNQ